MASPTYGSVDVPERRPVLRRRGRLIASGVVMFCAMCLVTAGVVLEDNTAETELLATNDGQLLRHDMYWTEDRIHRGMDHVGADSSLLRRGRHERRTPGDFSYSVGLLHRARNLLRRELQISAHARWLKLHDFSKPHKVDDAIPFPKTAAPTTPAATTAAATSAAATTAGGSSSAPACPCVPACPCPAASSGSSGGSSSGSASSGGSSSGGSGSSAKSSSGSGSSSSNSNSGSGSSGSGSSASSPQGNGDRIGGKISGEGTEGEGGSYPGMINDTQKARLLIVFAFLACMAMLAGFQAYRGH